MKFNPHITFSSVIFFCKTVALLVCIRLALDLSYVYFISPSWSYQGLALSVQKWRLAESYLLTVMLSLFVPRRFVRPSDFLLFFFYLLIILPLLSLYGLLFEQRPFIWMVAFCFLLMCGIRFFPIIRLPVVRYGRFLLVIASGMMVFVVIAFMVIHGGLANFNLDLTRVYEFRKLATTALSGGLFGYINFWVTKVLNPFLIVYFFFVKRYFLSVSFIGIQIILFGMTGHKSVLFYPFLTLSVLYLLDRKNVNLKIIYSYLFIVVSSSSIALVFNNFYFVSLFVRRVFFVPAYLSYIYYKYFSENGFVYMSNSVLSHWINYPYQLSPPFLIGKYAFGKGTVSANNGFLACGYMHFGFLGMVLFSLIVSMILMLVDSLVDGSVSLGLGVALVIVPFFALFSSADLSTAFLSHGLGLSLLMLWLLGQRRSLRSPLCKDSDDR